MSYIKFNEIFVPVTTTDLRRSQDELDKSNKLSETILNTYRSNGNSLSQPIRIIDVPEDIQKTAEHCLPFKDLDSMQALLTLQRSLPQIAEITSPEKYFSEVSVFIATCKAHNFDPKCVGLTLNQDLFIQGANAKLTILSSEDSLLEAPSAYLEHLDVCLTLCKEFSIETHALQTNFNTALTLLSTVNKTGSVNFSQSSLETINTLSVRQTTHYKGLEKNLDAWVLDQPNQEDALKVKRHILEACNENPFASIELCISSVEITSLPSCLSTLRIQSLDCSNCTSLKMLPELLSCTYMDCSGCVQLTSLPKLPHCINLNCSGCTFSALPELINCTNLNCSGCVQLATLPELPSCIYLNCSRCTFSELPELPSCTMLNCSGCTFSELPELLICEDLTCSECIQLVAFPELPRCIFLDCSGCIQIVALPELQHCINLNCSGCVQIVVLPGLPRCIFLDCRHCISLRTLPQLPRCRDPQYDGCSQLSYTPQILMHNFDGGIVRSSCDISWKDLHEKPSEVLKTLRPFLEEPNFPDISFLDETGKRQEGADAGGLARHLMAEIFAQISQKKLIPGGTSDKGLCPTVPKNKELKYAEMYETIGLLFVKAYQEHLPIGEVFDQQFFQYLQAFSGNNLSEYEEDPGKWVREQCEKQHVETIQQINNTTSLEELSQLEFVAIYGYEISEAYVRKEITQRSVEVTEAGVLEECKKKLFDEFIEAETQTASELYNAAFLVAKAMQNQTGAASWEELCSFEPKEIQDLIQGCFCKELFANSIEWSGKSDLKTQGYLQHWIEAHSDEEVKQLLQFTTGSLSIPAGQKIDVQLFEPDEGEQPLPTSHTCGYQIVIPTNYANQEVFDEKLKCSIDNSQDPGFTSL